MQQQRSPKPAGGYNEFRRSWALAEFIAGLFAKTIEVYMRYDFGARYFNISDFLGGSFTILVFFGSAILYITPNTADRLAVDKEGSKIALFLFLLGFCLMTALHLGIAAYKNRKGRRWHSRYSGTSYLGALLPNHPYIVKRYIEPSIAAIVGYQLVKINSPLGAWIVFSGLCLAATEQIGATRDRNRIYDALDAQIEAQQLARVIKDKQTPERTEGFALPIPRHFDEKQRESIYQGMVQLDPALQAIMDASPDASSGQSPR